MSEPPRILIRTDASTVIGTGHLRRCLAVADALREIGIDSEFIIRQADIDVGAMVRRAGHSAVLLEPAATADANLAERPHSAWARVSEEVDAVQAATAASGRPCTVVVDHYAFGAAWHRAMAAALDVPIVVIDDLAECVLAADLVIDHNVVADPLAKHAASLREGGRLLAGPKFALIDPAYARAPRYVESARVRSIGLFLGGIDAVGLSLPVARALRAGGFYGPIGIAATSANPQAAAIMAAADWLGCAPTIDAPDLSAFFAAHDLQIGAAGGATWERCCIGAPTLLLAVADNQKQVLEALRNSGAVSVYDGPHDASAIAAAAQTLAADPQRRAEQSERSHALVDGQGAMRTAVAIASLSMRMRGATMDDAERMFDWRNDPTVRAQSRQSAQLKFADHVRWLERAIADERRVILIALAGTRPIGVVRFDGSQSSSDVEVSIYLDPALAGMGIGGAVLERGEAALACRIDGPVRLIAETLPDNRPSQRLFERAGYERCTMQYKKTLQPAIVG